jgi:hypothetical protein
VQGTPLNDSKKPIKLLKTLLTLFFIFNIILKYFLEGENEKKFYTKYSKWEGTKAYSV